MIQHASIIFVRVMISIHSQASPISSRTSVAFESASNVIVWLSGNGARTEANSLTHSSPSLYKKGSTCKLQSIVITQVL